VNKLSPERAHPIAALVMAAVCHAAFVLAVGSMAWALASGMQIGHGSLTGVPAAIANGLLLLQFPILHSLLLSRRGAGTLRRLSPVGHGRTLAITTFALFGSVQLLATFWLWSPSGVTWHSPEGTVGMLQWAVFGLAWLFLIKALHDAGLGVQSGAAGWWALLRGKAVNFGSMPSGGLFRGCRQPIYLGFAMVLWTAPTWSLDWLLLSLVWGSYCAIGPLLKEARWLRMYGSQFAEYRASVPYLLPRLRR
jgi:protein-S-isoprenylcysteine O-methyltransferase Ste14